LQHADLLRNGN